MTEFKGKKINSSENVELTVEWIPQVQRNFDKLFEFIWIFLQKLKN